MTRTNIYVGPRLLYSKISEISEIFKENLINLFEQTYDGRELFEAKPIQAIIKGEDGGGCSLQESPGCEDYCKW